MARTTFWFEPALGGTTVTIEFELETGGLPPGLLAPLGWAIEGNLTQVLNRDLNRRSRRCKVHG